MARPPPTFKNLFLCKNPKTLKNSNHQFRNIGISGSDEFSNQSFNDVVKEVSKIIRTKPRWEQTLLSDFPTVNFLDSSFLNDVLKHQNNTFLSLRLLYWLNSTFGVSPEQSTCSLMFKALVKTNAAKAAKSFLDFTKFVPEPTCLESYVRCLCESRLMEEALEVFDEMTKMGTCPALETWNLGLMGCIKVGQTDFVWKLYGDMIECGVVADVDTVEYLIQAFCMDNNVSKGYELLRQVLETGHVPNKISFDTLISGFVKDRKYYRVSALLHTMIAKGVEPDISTYQQIIHGLCMRRMRHEGFRIFNDLKDRGYAPDRIMYTTMISGLCKMKWLGDARKLWFEMIQKGINPNEYTYCVLIYGFCKIGNLEEAQRLYKEMCDRGYRETTVSYTTMINGLCKNGKTQEACGLFQEMVQKGVACDVITYNSLIQGFCKEGKISESVNLLHELLEQGLQPSTASYTVIIEKLCEVGHIDEAKILWKDMQDRGLEPAACTNDFIILGLSKEGDVAEGIDWLANMLQNRLVPRRETLEKLIHILYRRDKLSDALLVLGYMFKIGYSLTEGICHLLVNKLCEDDSHHVETCISNIIGRT